MSGAVTLNPSDSGTKKKWKFKNDTGEPIFDFFIKTGPISFLEIEWPWGDTGNPPDLRKFTIREDGFEDGSKSFDDVVEGKATIDPPVENGKEFEIELEFDDPFEPLEYVQITPTDKHGVTIEDDNRTETEEPNTGTQELIDGVGKVIKTLGSLDVQTSDLKANFAYNKLDQKYVLSMLRGSQRKPVKIAVAQIKRKAIKQTADYGLETAKPRKRNKATKR